MEFIAISVDGSVRIDFRDDQRLEIYLKGGATESDIATNNITPYATSQSIANYVTSVGYSEGTYWDGENWVEKPTTVWAVFATETDLENSFIQHRSLDGKRYVLTPKRADYIYENAGKHTGSIGADIPPQQLTDTEISILLDSSYFNENVLWDGIFCVSDAQFGRETIGYIKTQINKPANTYAAQSAAFVLCLNALQLLEFGLILPAFANITAIATEGAFTNEMKTEILSRFTAYLNKFPR